MKAKDINEYREAWTWNINQLAILSLAADVEYSHYIAIKRTLETWLEYAINHQTEKDLLNGQK